jgi:hypothetical protein
VQLIKGLFPLAANVNDTAGGALAYNSLSYGNQALTGTLVAPSSEGTVGYAGLQQITPGGSPPSWFPMAPYVFFDQAYICGACQLDQNEPAAAIPISCSLEFTGVSYTTGETAVEVLQFNPQTLPTPFACTKFPDTFKALRSVSVQLIQAPTPQLVDVVLLDNNTYTAYREC